MPATPTPEQLARRIATARKIRGLMGENHTNQTGLGRIIGRSQPVASKLLNAQDAFTTDQLELIATAFDVPITELFPNPSDRDRAEAMSRNRWSSPEMASV